MRIFLGVILSSLVYLQMIQTWQAEHGIIHYFEMNETRYRSVFLKTDEKLYNFFYLHPKAQTLSDTLPNDYTDDVLQAVHNETFLGKASDYQALPLFSADFEKEQIGVLANKIIASFGSASKYCYKLDSGLDYSPAYIGKYSEVVTKKRTWARASVDVFFTQLPRQNDFAIVACVGSNGATIKYTEAYINPRIICIGSWNSLSLDYCIPENRTDNDELRIYCLNRGRHSIYMDNFKVELLQPKK